MAGCKSTLDMCTFVQNQYQDFLNFPELGYAQVLAEAKAYRNKNVEKDEQATSSSSSSLSSSSSSSSWMKHGKGSAMGRSRGAMGGEEEERPKWKKVLFYFWRRRRSSKLCKDGEEGEDGEEDDDNGGSSRNKRKKKKKSSSGPLPRGPKKSYSGPLYHSGELVPPASSSFSYSDCQFSRTKHHSGHQFSRPSHHSGPLLSLVPAHVPYTQLTPRPNFAPHSRTPIYIVT